MNSAAQLIQNATVYTVDPARPQAAAVVRNGNRFAIGGYTRNAADAKWMEAEKGMLRAGFFDGDLLATPPTAIDGVRPRVTICDGIVGWRGD